MKDIQVAIDDRLRVFFGGFIFLLNLDQEPVKLIDRHDAILRVLIEKGLDGVRHLRYGDMEPPPEAEADSVSLFRHDKCVIEERVIS